MKKKSRSQSAHGMEKRGRPKRDPALLSQLLNWEFEWNITFEVLRYGAPGWDTSFPNPEIARLKWRNNVKSEFRTEDERRFWQKHNKEHFREADEEFTKKIILAEPGDIPAEQEIWKQLSDPRTGHTAVRRACQRSHHYLRRCPGYRALYSRAKEFCRAKRDKRYPRSNRQSSEDKRAEYLARVMAGLSLPKPLNAATAMDILRKMRHGKHCQCWRCVIIPPVSRPPKAPMLGVIGALS